MKRVFFPLLCLLAACSSLHSKPKDMVKTQLLTRWAKVCRADQEKFCANWSPKDGSTADCLARVEKELSGRCYQVLRESAGPCVFDRARWCSQVRPSDPRVWSCLEGHGKEVSLSCRTFRADLKTREADLRKSCASDVTKLCGGSGSWRCLREHLDKASAPCRDSFARSLKATHAG